MLVNYARLKDVFRVARLRFDWLGLLNSFLNIGAKL